VAEVAPEAKVTAEGIVSEALLSVSATTVPPVGAGWFKVTVHAVAAPEFTLVGLQARAVTSMGATRLKVAVWAAPLSVALMVADCVVVSAPAVAANVAEMAPAAKVTEAGTVSEALLSERATTVPPAGAGWFSVTVQVPALPDDRLEGLHCREVRASDGAKVRVVVRELLPSEPVITAVCVVVKVPAVAVKPAEVCPAATATEPGTVSAGLLDAKAIVAADGAGWLSITRQAVALPTPRLETAHCR